MRVREFINMLEAAEKEVGNCQLYFSAQGNDTLIPEDTELGLNNYDQDDDVLVVDLVDDSF